MIHIVNETPTLNYFWTNLTTATDVIDQRTGTCRWWATIFVSICIAPIRARQTVNTVRKNEKCIQLNAVHIYSNVYTHATLRCTSSVRRKLRMHDARLPYAVWKLTQTHGSHLDKLIFDLSDRMTYFYLFRYIFYVIWEHFSLTNWNFACHWQFAHTDCCLHMSIMYGWHMLDRFQKSLLYIKILQN